MTLHEQIERYYPAFSDIQRYPTDKCACIRKTFKKWGIFGSFYKVDIVINGVTFDCTTRSIAAPPRYGDFKRT